MIASACFRQVNVYAERQEQASSHQHMFFQARVLFSTGSSCVSFAIGASLLVITRLTEDLPWSLKWIIGKVPGLVRRNEYSAMQRNKLSYTCILQYFLLLSRLGDIDELDNCWRHAIAVVKTAHGVTAVILQIRAQKRSPCSGINGSNGCIPCQMLSF